MSHWKQQEAEGSLLSQERQRSQYAPSIVAASSAAGSVAARSRVTGVTRATNFTKLTAEAPEDRGFLMETLAFFYDPRDGRVCGRAPLDFALLVGLHCACYAVTAVVMAIGWVVFSFLVINEDVPQLTGTHNALRLTPTIAVRPNFDFMGTLVQYRQSRPESYLIHSNHLQAYLDQYELFYNTERDVNIVKCDIWNYHKASSDPMDVCRFELKWLNPCTKQSYFGYPRGTPCVLLKLNRVYGWVPDIEQPELSKNILVKCNGRFNADIDNVGDIRYFPSEVVNGTEYGLISPLFYPYLTQVGFRSPLVAVQFTSPRRNVAIMVECEMFNVANVAVDRVRGIGYASFELLID